MMSVSFDGFIEGPDRELDWHMVDDELHSRFNDQLRAMGAFLHGRVTYELMVGFWPTTDTDASSTAPMVEFAGIWRDMPKIVYSRTLERAGWNTTIVRDLVVEEVMALKAQPGEDLALGGPDLAAAFMQHDLIDERMLRPSSHHELRLHHPASSAHPAPSTPCSRRKMVRASTTTSPSSSSGSL